MICEFCIALAGRFVASRECCQIRLLATAPAHNRKAVYARTQASGGENAVTELKQKVAAEYQRQQEHKRAIAQQQIARSTAVGRERAASLLKTIKESGMHIPPIERACTAPALQEGA